MFVISIIFSFIVIFLEIVGFVGAILEFTGARTNANKKVKADSIFHILYGIFIILAIVLLLVQVLNPKVVTVEVPLESSTDPVEPVINSDEPMSMSKLEIPYYISNSTQKMPEEYVNKKLASIIEPLSNDSGFFYYTNYYKNSKCYEMPMTEKWQKIVYEYCELYSLDYETVLAIGGVETSFDVHRGIVVSRYNGATYFGLGMVNKYYYEKRTETELSTERDGINALCDTLRRKLKEFDGNYIYALMAYNGGSSYARKRIENGVYSSTYVEKVMKIKNGLLKWRNEQ